MRASDPLSRFKLRRVCEVMNLKKEEFENDEQFIWRLCQAKDSGLLDMSWNEVADILNKELDMGDMPFTASAYRKPYQQAKRFHDAGVFGEIDESSEIVAQRHELEKEKVKLRDERNELKRLLREQARKESFVEQVKRAVVDNVEHRIGHKDKVYLQGDTDIVVTLTDLHTGIVIDNSWNKFDEDVLKSRLGKYLDKICEVSERHNVENAHVIISEIISGLIHTPLRIESNQNVIEQFLTAADLIADFLYELCDMVDTVHVYVAPGNHSRVVANKNELAKAENFDHLIIPYIGAKLQNENDIVFHVNDIEESMAVFSVRGLNVVAVHGDKDDPKSVVSKITMMLDYRPSVIFMAHRHTNAMHTEYDTKVITSGCLSGSDNFCMDKRLRNRPEQVIAVFGNDGLDCVYDVKF